MIIVTVMQYLPLLRLLSTHFHSPTQVELLSDCPVVQSSLHSSSTAPRSLQGPLKAHVKTAERSCNGDHVDGSYITVFDLISEQSA